MKKNFQTNGMATNNEKQKNKKNLSNMTKHVKKYQDKEPITERMTATAEKSKEVKQWKSQSKTDRKNQSVSSIKTF